MNGINLNASQANINQPKADPDTYAKQYADQNGLSLEEAKAELKAKFGDPKEGNQVPSLDKDISIFSSSAADITNTSISDIDLANADIDADTDADSDSITFDDIKNIAKNIFKHAGNALESIFKTLKGIFLGDETEQTKESEKA